MKAASLPTSVCRGWFGGSPPTSVEPMGGGFSGAGVYCCDGPYGRVVLRQWPPATEGRRLVEIHHVMQTAYDHGCRAVPRLRLTRDGANAVKAGPHFWDCVTWKHGRAWEKETSPLGATEAVRAGCQMIGVFHRSVASLTTQSGPSPAVQTRWRRLGQMESWLRQPLRYQEPGSEWDGANTGALPSAWLSRAERQVKTIWQRNSSMLRDRLKTYLALSLPLQYVLRDVHRDHVLFEGRQVSGLIDFDAVRVDTPAADLARYVSSFFDAAQLDLSLTGTGNAVSEPRPTRFVDAIWEAAMAGYRTERTFSEQELELAKFLAKIGPWLALANWAIWSTSEPRSFPASPERIVARAEHLSHCLHTTFAIC